MYLYRTFNPLKQLIHNDAYQQKISEILEMYSTSIGDQIPTRQNFKQFVAAPFNNISNSTQLLVLLCAVRHEKSKQQYDPIGHISRDMFREKLLIWLESLKEMEDHSVNVELVESLLNDESTWSSILGLEDSDSDSRSSDIEETVDLITPSDLIQSIAALIMEEEGLVSSN